MDWSGLWIGVECGLEWIVDWGRGGIGVEGGGVEGSGVGWSGVGMGVEWGMERGVEWGGEGRRGGLECREGWSSEAEWSVEEEE